MQFSAALILTLIEIGSCTIVNFTGQVFADLSTYNFNLGRTPVQEFSLIGSDQETIQLYLFQNNYKQYNLAVHDGPDGSAPIISIDAFIPPPNQLAWIPAPIRSSGPAMYVRVEAYSHDQAASLDFQAMATVYDQPADCGDLVVSLSNLGHTYDHYFNSSACIYVLHANDPTNNPVMAQYILSTPNLGSESLNVYKGLAIQDNNRLMDFNPLRKTTWATDKYLTIVTQRPVQLTIGGLFNEKLNTNKTVSQGIHGQFMTVDYFQDPYPNTITPLEMNFVLNLAPPMTSIRITFLHLFGAGSLEVVAYLNGTKISDAKYLPSLVTWPLGVIFTCDMIQLSYKTSTIPADGISGFYGVYDDVTIYPPSTVVATTKTTTTRQIQTATKSSETLFSSANLCVLTTLLYFM